MKRIVMAFAVLSSFLGLLSFSSKDDDLTKLWKDYNAAEKADRPKKQLEILDRIGDIASTRHLAYDYYRYLSNYQNVSVRINWKLRDSLNLEYERKVREFDEPILSFVTGLYAGNSSQFVKDNENRLRSAVNNGFYDSFSQFESKCIINDYEYVVWQLRNSDEQLYLATLKERFSEKAVAMYGRSKALRDEFYKIQNNVKSTEADYKGIYDKLVQYRKECATFKGIDADLVACWRLVGLENLLLSTEVSVSATEDIVTVLTRNLPSVNISLRKDETLVHSSVVKNDRKSFYVYDTLTYRLPLLDDGKYKLEASKGKESVSEVYYKKYTISLSQRHDAGGYSFYAADYHTGKPMEKLNVFLYRSGKLLATAENLSSVNGYAYLPAEFQKKIDEKRVYEYTISCGYRTAEGHLRLSETTGLTSSYSESYKGETFTRIFLDRTLCKPGETLHYKVLVYDVDGQYSSKVVENGTVTVRIFNSELKTVHTATLRTNAFGTVAGSFDIPHDQRNGRWAIEADSGNSSSSKSFRVEDVVLPTFELTFDPQDHIAVIGETITVTGTVKGYNGHSPSSARITYSVTEYGSIVKSGELKPDASGRFSLSFPAEKVKNRDWRSFNISVKVADLTGETLEFSTYREASASVSMNAFLLNQAEGDLRLNKDSRFAVPRLLTDRVAKFRIDSEYGALPVEYKVYGGGKVVASGKCKAGENFEIDFSALPQGIYRFESTASKGDFTCGSDIDILKISPEDRTLEVEVEHLFLPLEADVPAFRIGTTTAPMWACVSLYGPGNELLANRLVYLGGEKGKESSFADVYFDGLAVYPEYMTACVLYFRDCEVYSWNRQYTGPVRNTKLPLTFERFHDITSPASKYSFSIKTASDVEAVLTVYDKALESLSPNPYSTLVLPHPWAPNISVSSSAARVGSEDIFVVGYGKAGLKGRLMRSVASNAKAMALSDVVEEEAVMAPQTDYAAPANGAAPQPAVRSDFRTTLAFEPFLRSGADGRMEFDLTTSDKTSTYVVQLFAHDKSINTGVLKQEMLVSVPVEISVREPRFLYSGDRYVLSAKLSNALATAVSGTVSIDLYDGDDYRNTKPVSSQKYNTGLSVGQEMDFEKEIVVPEGIETLGIKLTFISDDPSQVSDAVFVKTPVYPAKQVITEAHSSVMLAGADRDALIAQLRSLFVNGPGEKAEVSEISIRNMLDEALSEQIDTTALNAVSVSGMLLAIHNLETLRPGCDYSAEKARLAARLEACHNADGGYGWMPEMKSSAIITAVVLERLAPTEWFAGQIQAAQYLDNAYVAVTASGYHWWCDISIGMYLYVRSMYPQAAFKASEATSKELRAFRKQARNFLVPGKDRGLQGLILTKTRRALTLRNLSESPYGRTLAKDWGVRLAAASRIDRSLEKDKASIREYMVEHRSGGAYYPNAVMPWRGLLESELYAHTLLHRLLGDDRISIWMMVQKETQQWGCDPAYSDALAEVLHSSEETLQTKVVTLTANWDLPFQSIKESGNGMKISRTYYREDVDPSGTVRELPLSDGDLLHVGDKVTVRYNIWNEENRSFVRLTASRPASLSPENQFSGRYGWRPRSGGPVVLFTPQGYRNVKAEATEYWFDVYPEENSTISESFFVTQKGFFQTPALVIESLYAPHYRANDAPSPLSSN